MIRDTLDNKKFRLTFALSVGAPLTILFLVALPSGLIMGIVGLRELEVPMLSMGFAAILGSFGVIGAWLRLVKRIDSFTPGQIVITRTLLACGIASTIILLILSIWAETFLHIGLPMTAVLVGGTLFYVGT